jgi:hypothetical protein
MIFLLIFLSLAQASCTRNFEGKGSTFGVDYRIKSTVNDTSVTVFVDVSGVVIDCVFDRTKHKAKVCDKWIEINMNSERCLKVAQEYVSALEVMISKDEFRVSLKKAIFWINESAHLVKKSGNCKKCQ